MTSDDNVSGPQIREAREGKNLSVDQLSQKCLEHGLELSAKELEQIENQQRGVSDSELLGIAKALEVSGTTLLFGKGPLPWDDSKND